MDNNVTSLVDIQTRKVNEYCARLCKEELKLLDNTQFEDFAKYLELSWMTFFGHLGMGADEMLPIIQSRVYGNELELFSCLVSLQFTDRPVPVALPGLNVKVLRSVLWKRVEGDGSCNAKLPSESSSNGKQKVTMSWIENILKDIFTDHRTDEECPIHLVILISQMTIYHLVNGMVYTGSEYDVQLDDHENPVIKAVFTNGLKKSEIYIDYERMKHDWIDFTKRHNEHFGIISPTSPE